MHTTNGTSKQLANLLGRVVAIIGTAFHWGINGPEPVPKGFVATKRGGATGLSHAYLWRIKVGELVVPLYEHAQAVFEAKVADS